MTIRPVALAVGFAAACSALAAADAVIMPDGFVIPGKEVTESNPKGYSFHMVLDGPKYTIYSSHSKKGGKVENNVPRPDFVAYRVKTFSPISNRPPGFGEMKATEFDDKWKRTVRITQPGGLFTEVKQYIYNLDPNSCLVASATHNWNLAFHTSEMDPRTVRRLLATHKELAEEPGKPDPAKRLAIASFLKDVNEPAWLALAREELNKAKKDIPGEWPADNHKQAETLKDELDLADTRFALDDIEAAFNSGRLDYASRALAGFTPKVADPKVTARLAVLKANIETVAPRFEETYRLLDELIRRESFGPTGDAHAAVGGAVVARFAPKPPTDPAVGLLLPGAEAVRAEVHPTTADRLDLFTNLAKQADARRRDGKEPGTKPAELLALAVTGWLKGKNGADPEPLSAVRSWATREMALAYLRESVPDVRKKLLASYLGSGSAVTPEELAQVMSLLPPPLADPPGTPPGKEVPKADADGVPGVYSRETPGSEPVQYFLRLPPGYQHGRSYPVLLALTHTSVPAEKLVGMLAPQADKYGYIVAAPVWGTSFTSYNWAGERHPLALAVLRDVLRRYQADPDKAFLFGLGEGATFAFDLGASHPDLFAGVVTLGSSPLPSLYMHYWRNAQFLPYFVVTGETGGDSYSNLRKVYERWMPKGFPSLLTVYRGRGVEWYARELPRAFDWMGRKTRTRGTAALKLDAADIEAWQIGREGDDRFYWVGTTGIKANHLIRGNISTGWVPATIKANIRPGNEVVLNTQGTKTVVVWLERGMIDWTKPVRVTLNGGNPLKYTPKVLTPDLALTFEELYRSGDRKVLMFGRLEFITP